MIYVTGDTHIPIDIKRLNTKNFPEQKEMTKDDFVIICGDFGGVWDGSNEEKYWLKWLEEKNFMTLFVDGNHENHKMLNSFPISDFCGGKAHKISDSIYHLMRGEIYIFEDKKFFTMGGAESHDKAWRRINISWWPEEMPFEEEYENAVNNLNKYNWDVDVIISHCCPDSIQNKINSNFKHDKLTNFFEHVVKEDCTYKKWYFGHYHVDVNVDEKHTCLYNWIIKVK